jgi:hypothetical protein
MYKQEQQHARLLSITLNEMGRKKDPRYNRIRGISESAVYPNPRYNRGAVYNIL